MDTNISYWISNSDSVVYQIFMLVMGVLYALAYVAGVSYKAMNIYIYFILYPTTFLLFFKSKIKYFIIPCSLLFFIIPKFETISNSFFDICVVFLNTAAKKFSSDYITMSVYLCVIVPIIFYLPFLIFKLGIEKFIKVASLFICVLILYYLFLAPQVKPLLISLSHYIR
jgi:hypothetical protein